MARNIAGIVTHGAVARCMVMGCPKKALYRSPTSVNNVSDRGYCGDHKAFAMSGNNERTAILNHKWLLRMIGE